jgi:hypothetical protein
MDESNDKEKDEMGKAEWFATTGSSNVQAIRFSNNQLQVQFLSGGMYTYNNVPLQVYEGFKTAASYGGYLSEVIKGRYPYMKNS